MAGDQPAPGASLLVFDAARLPAAGPVEPYVVDLVFGRRRLEGVDRAGVGIDADPELVLHGAPYVNGLESGLQPQRQQQYGIVVAQLPHGSSRIGEGGELGQSVLLGHAGLGQLRPALLENAAGLRLPLAEPLASFGVSTI